MDTKTCSLTEDEIRQLIACYGSNLSDIENKEDMGYNIERIAYLNKRLKAAFKEDTSKPEEQPKAEAQPEPKVTTGW